MTIILNVLIACFVFQATSCTSISLSPHEGLKDLTTTSTELLSSLQNCLVFIFDFADDDSLASTKYIKFLSEYMYCAVFVETFMKNRTNTFNSRFQSLKPHPLFVRHTTNLVNLYTPDATSDILKTFSPIYWFYEVMLHYNVPFNYILIFMSNEELSSIDNVGLFRKLATVSVPAVYLLVLDEETLNVVGFAHAFQAVPFLFKVTKFQEAQIQQLNRIIHKDMQGVICRAWWSDESWEKCRYGKEISSHPHLCALDMISGNLNITFLKQENHPESKLSISEIVVKNQLSPDLMRALTRQKIYGMVFVGNVIDIDEHNFICIATVSTKGLIAFVQAYDVLTWIIAVSTCLCLSAAIAAMATSTKNSFWTKLQSATPVVLMLIIERFYGYGQVIHTASRQIGLVITLWAFAAMLLGMIYSGNMVSELTSPSLPECPHDMQELAEIEQYPIFTEIMVYDNGVRKPYYHVIMEEYLTEYSNKSGSLVSVLRQFEKTLTFVDIITVQRAALNYSTSSKILLAFIGPTYQVSAFGMWSMTDANSRKLSVLDGVNLSFFKSLEPMLVQTNFLGPILQTVLENLSHSGIFKYWQDGEYAWRANDVLKLIEKASPRESNMELLRKSNLALIWRKFNPDLMTDEAPERGMTLENLIVALEGFGICMLLALCIFMNERHIFQLVGRHLFKIVKNVPTVLNRSVGSFAMLVMNRATVAVQREPN